MSSSDQPTSGSSDNQSLRWSLQNFPVPLQLQARMPRSPLSVAQELLPNFPSHVGQNATSYNSSNSHHHHHQQQQQVHNDDEYVDLQQEQQRSNISQQQQHQFQLSLQQHIQQQLQQQFQRQLQLNLQGGHGGQGEPVILPEPPDTVIDLDDDEGSGGAGDGESSRLGGALGRLSAATSSRRLLESLLRSAQAAASSSSSPVTSVRNHSNNNNDGNSNGMTDSNSSGIGGGTASGGGLSSLVGHGHHHPHHHHQHHQLHLQQHGVATVGGGEGDHVAPVGATSPSDANRATGAPQGLQQGAELTLLYKWAATSGIFILLLLLHFLYDHRLGLLVFLCLGGTFYYTNMKLVHAIHQSAVREQSRSWMGFLNLFWLSGFLILNIFILYSVFRDQSLWRILFYQMATVEDISVWTLLWCVVLTDYIIKFLTIISKSFVAMMQPFCGSYRRRGKYYLLIESISQLYRQSVTVVPWLYYLNDSTRTSMWFAFITEAVYLGFKGWSVWGSIQFLYSSFQRFQSNTSFGTKPSSSDMLERGNQCPICQDSVSEPVMLPCKHIFCEQCVSIWFDREKTCPMCRAEITTESPMWKDGNTSSHLQWH